MIGLFKAARTGESDKVLQILRDESDDSLRAQGSSQALMYAAWIGHIDTVHKLCDFGVNVNYQAPITQRTALMFASRYHHVDVVKQLLISGADYGLKDWEGRKALEYAVCSEDAAIIKLLTNGTQNLPLSERQRR